jgi:hypothetical protein
MAYVGTPIDTTNQFQSLQGKRFSGDGSTTAFTLDIAPSSVFDIEVFVENVRQDPNSAYTLSGTTMTFTGAPASGTNNIYVIHQAKAVGTIGVLDGAITTAKLGADAVTEAKIADDAVESEHLNNNIISGQTALTSGLALDDEILVSDGGTIKKMDVTVLTPTLLKPYFSATNSGTQDLTSGTTANIVFQTEIIDSDGCFNNTGNSVTLNGISTDANSFAPNVSGYYHLGASVHFQTVADNTSIEMMIYKNQGAVIRNMIHSSTSKDLNPFVSLIIDANGTSDDFQVAVRLDGSNENAYYSSGYVRFWGYRIG